MSQSLDRKYIMMLASRLEGFRQKSANLYNCRAYCCGDSKSRKRIKRGYFYLKGDHFLYFCHNCQYSTNIKGVLKQLDNSLYQQYRLEAFEQPKTYQDTTPVTKTNIALRFDDSFYSQELKKLQKISQLAINHPAKLYIEKRKIPTEFHSLLRWCPSFMTWTNTLQKGTFDEKALRYADAGRIVIPYFTQNHRFFGFAGRAIDNSDKRYINILLDKGQPLLYGLDRIDWTKTVYVVEGAIDSMFLDNCLALSGSNISSIISLTTNNDYDKFVVIFDNEPHSREAYKKIESAIQQGFKVCIWPRWITSKDINELVLKGMSLEYIKELIDDNIFDGLTAKIRLEEWSRS